MLQNDWFEALSDERAFPLHPKNGKNISIFSDDSMFFTRILVKLAVISEVKFGLRMCAKANPSKN